MKYPAYVQKIIESLKKLPGVGAKSAERFAFAMITWHPQELTRFAALVENIPFSLKNCEACGCLTDEQGCPFCSKGNRLPERMCVVAFAKDVFAIEETREFDGLYHVLGGVLSPLEGKGPDDLTVGQLRKRLEAHAVQELIIALDSTLEGDATALYLKKEFQSMDVKVTRLAFGIPMGSSFDYVDGGTLARALAARNVY